MKSRRNALILPCIVVCAMSCLTAYSDDRDKSREESRREMIANFNRTGMDTTPGDAMLLRILVESSGAKRGVEVGSYKGFGTINMGVAFERTGGHLFTLEIDPQTADTCRENLKKAGLDKTVTCITGDALKTIPELEGEFDFVFIDAVKRDYLKYLKAIEPKLKPGAIIVADNVIKSEKAMQDFLDYIQKSPAYDTVILRASMEKNDGVSVTFKIR